MMKFRHDTGGERMLKVEQYEYIRTAHRVYDKSVSEIARETGHSRNTIKKILRGEYQRYLPRKSQPFPVLGDFLEIIDEWLDDDVNNPPKQRHTAKRVYARLVKEYGFNGSESNVRHYVGEAKRARGLKGPGAFVPLSPDPGLEAEMDWGTATAILGGELTRLKLFCMRSKYSGNPFLRLYPCERQQAFFDGLCRGFDYYGGVFPVMVFDNLSLAVDKVLRGKKRKEQDAFVRFRSWYTFEGRFCNPGKGNEKGGVEGLVGFSRRNFLVPIPRGENLEEINEDLLRECISYGSRHIEGREGTVKDLHDIEKGLLLPLTRYPFTNEQTLSSRTDKYATVMVDKNRYSVPSSYAGITLRTVLTVDRVQIYKGSRLLASHGREYGNNKWSLNPDHYLDLIRERPGAFRDARPLKEWKKKWGPEMHSLLDRFQKSWGENRGIKEFIDVLLLYRLHEEKEVADAIQESLAKGLSSAAGVRHVLESGRIPAERVLPLEAGQWKKFPPADVSAYSVLEKLR